MIVASYFIIGAGIIFTLFGVVGIFRFKSFYARILVTGKIETVGAITLLIGVAVRHGFNYFSLKVLMLMAIMLILTPLATHIVARSAYLSGTYSGKARTYAGSPGTERPWGDKPK